MMTVPIYGDPNDPVTNQYPGSYSVRYPKAGSPVPSITLFVYDVDSPGSSIPMLVSPPGELNQFTDGIIHTAVDWINEGETHI